MSDKPKRHLLRRVMGVAADRADDVLSNVEYRGVERSVKDQVRGEQARATKSTRSYIADLAELKGVEEEIAQYDQDINELAELIEAAEERGDTATYQALAKQIDRIAGPYQRLQDERARLAEMVADSRADSLDQHAAAQQMSDDARALVMQARRDQRRQESLESRLGVTDQPKVTDRNYERALDETRTRKQWVQALEAASRDPEIAGAARSGRQLESATRRAIREAREQLNGTGDSADAMIESGLSRILDARKKNASQPGRQIEGSRRSTAAPADADAPEPAPVADKPAATDSPESAPERPATETNGQGAGQPAAPERPGMGE